MKATDTAPPISFWAISIALLFRRAWALPLYVISVVFFLVVLYWAFVIDNVANVMSGGLYPGRNVA